ncbi:dihydrodipicolinate synthase family protein [Halopenitus persicus]|uniref:4-hydroxy-tetrahydrodipicolinate synthase n=1 Tax=Halopenitus persicus TaxID=1048396 RepID=A0A1H3EQL0_9EURY|nr:dihydrodipicolinate synthase family protein [Halopenitus persicus]SDX80229.1 4-hydroxy-tetrahydrodipicolinate synthase [Halopenitus persicus]
MNVREQLAGIAAPIVTPFTDEGATVDEPALVALLEHLEAAGIDAVFPCGTTGEFPSLTGTERRRVIEVTAETVDVPVIAGAAATNVPETVAAIEAAEAAGADAAAVVAPYFATATAPEGNRRVFEAVLDRSPLPVLLYNIPQCVGTRIEPETVAAVADHERTIGIKDSSGDLAYFSRLVRETPDAFRCLQGYDALLVPALRAGGDGGINALSNVVPRVLRAAFEHAEDPRGRELQQGAISPLFEACTDHGFAPATKAALAHRGVVPNADVRPPLLPVADRSAIADRVDAALAALED